ncbi:hypothetical protein HUG17_6835 [Dermatophagoides farinae]|nr:hypothetical protein HUG17_6835 [Dermatophagoides farinae]
MTKGVNHKIKEKILIKSRTTIRPLSSSSSGTSEKSDDDSNNQKGDEDDDEQGSIPLLMNFIPRGMPNLFMSLKNFYIINMVIRNQIDRNFTFKDFVEGAKQALIHVSSHLANNQLDDLEGFIEPNALTEIRRNYEKLSMAQRQEFQLQANDIVLCFAHHINVTTMKEEFTGTRKHVVNLFIVFDCIKNLQETLEEKARSNQKINARELFREFNDHKFICNYEFQREYIEGVHGVDDMKKTDWIITKLLHIKEKDLIKLYM